MLNLIVGAVIMLVGVIIGAAITDNKPRELKAPLRVTEKEIAAARKDLEARGLIGRLPNAPHRVTDEKFYEEAARKNFEDDKRSTHTCDATCM